MLQQLLFTKAVRSRRGLLRKGGTKKPVLSESFLSQTDLAGAGTSAIRRLKANANGWSRAPPAIPHCETLRDAGLLVPLGRGLWRSDSK